MGRYLKTCGGFVVHFFLSENRYKPRRGGIVVQNTPQIKSSPAYVDTEASS